MRLTQVDYGTAKTVEYSLDALGNRTNEVQTVRPAVGSNVVTSFNGTFNLFNQQLTRNRSGGGLPALNTSFAYENNGSLLAETTGSAVTSYTWDRDNRLRTVTPPAPSVPTQYAYGANGLRVERVDSTGTTRYLLDGQSVLAELDGAGATTTRYINNPKIIDEIVLIERGGSPFWPLTDELGSIYATTDSGGAVVHRFDFDAYGVRADLGGSGPAFDVGYTGRWHDADGIIEHRRRTRRPEVGGWLQPDRMGLVDGPNSYGYARQRPTEFTDPTGFWINFAASHPDQLRILEVGISTRLGFRLYWQLFAVGQEVRFVHPSAFPPTAWTSGGGAGGVTGYLPGYGLSVCTEYLGVSIDVALAGGVPIEASMVHELRHAVDKTALRGTIPIAQVEPRAYAAQIIAEVELGAEFAEAFARVHGNRLYSWYSYKTLRATVFTDELFDQVRQVP